MDATTAALAMAQYARVLEERLERLHAVAEKYEAQYPEVTAAMKAAFAGNFECSRCRKNPPTEQMTTLCAACEKSGGPEFIQALAQCK